MIDPHFISGSLETIGNDIGRFLYQMKSEMDDNEIVKYAERFLNTFDVKIDTRDTEKMNLFMVSVARGYERAASE